MGLTVAVGAVVVASLQGCACTLAGCSTGATVSIDVPDDVTIPDGSTVTACFNDMCVSGALPSPSAVLPGSGLGITFPPGSGLSGILWAPDVVVRDRVEVEWSFADDARLRTGDRYRATLIGPAGATIAMKQATVTSYITVEPNGSSCGPTCHHAQFP